MHPHKAPAIPRTASVWLSVTKAHLQPPGRQVCALRFILHWPPRHLLEHTCLLWWVLLASCFSPIHSHFFPDRGPHLVWLPPLPLPSLIVEGSDLSLSPGGRVWGQIYLYWSDPAMIIQCSTLLSLLKNGHETPFRGFHPNERPSMQGRGLLGRVS